MHLDRSKGGYEYLLAAVDHFSKFVQAFPTKNKYGRAAADLLFNKYFLDLGFPKRILHEQGKEFDNKLFKRLSEITGVKLSRTTPYHTMGNGLCERMNRTIMNMLKTLPTTFKSNWKNHNKNWHLHTTTQNIGVQIIHHIFYCLAEVDAYQWILCLILTPIMTLKINLILIISKIVKTLWTKSVPTYTKTTKFYKETVNSTLSTSNQKRKKK